MTTGTAVAITEPRVATVLDLPPELSTADSSANAGLPAATVRIVKSVKAELRMAFTGAPSYRVAEVIPGAEKAEMQL
jgi:hypothetical protein